MFLFKCPKDGPHLRYHYTRGQPGAQTLLREPWSCWSDGTLWAPLGMPEVLGLRGESPPCCESAAVPESLKMG